jgi:hypothetical protein
MVTEAGMVDEDKMKIMTIEQVMARVEEKIKEIDNMKVVDFEDDE